MRLLGWVLCGIFRPHAAATIDQRASLGAYQLGILLRGMSFRSAGRTAFQSRSYDQQFSNSTEEQLMAIQSIEQHVLVPAAKIGWNVSIWIDVVVPSPHSKSFRRAIMERRGFDHKIVGYRTSTAYRAEQQGASLRESLDWCTTQTLAVWKAWSVLLVLRVDLVLRVNLPMPTPPELDKRLMVPFSLLELKQETGKCVKSYSDTILWVPRPAYQALHDFVNSCCHVSLHSLAGSGTSVRTFMPGANADSDSSAAWNPLYYMIGRPISMTTMAFPTCGTVVDKGR